MIGLPQHLSWANGAMDGFVTSRLPINPNDAVLTMGYYTRADIPFTMLWLMRSPSATAISVPCWAPPIQTASTPWRHPIDPAGQNGGPILQTIIANRASFHGRLTYTTMPEQLQTRGISWKVYSSPDENVLGGILSDNVLSYFKNFQDPASALHQNAFGPQFPVDFLCRCRIRKTCRKSPGS